MNDFEDRLTDALSQGAQIAPSVVGVAQGARRRSRQRRRRWAGAVAGLAVLAVLVPVGVGLTGGADSSPELTPPVTSAVDGWRTVTYKGEPYTENGDARVLLDLPPGWQRVDTSGCEVEPVSYGPPALEDPCGQTGRVSLYGSATFDPADLPGLKRGEDGWSGYVYAGQWAVYVEGLDAATARRVLGSSRAADDPHPDLSRSWTTRTTERFVLDAPPDAGVEITETTAGCGTRCHLAPRDPAEHTDDGRWIARVTRGGNQVLQVIAPTGALADLVAGSAVRIGHGGPVPSTWRTVEVDGVAFEVPAAWDNLDASRCERRDLDGLVRLGPPGTDPCHGLAPVSVLGADLYDSFGLPGLGGFTYADDRVLQVVDVEAKVARQMLASFRPADVDAPSLETWSTLELEDGITAQVPDDGSVQVKVRPGYPDCARDRSAAEQQGGEWRASLCRDRIVIVTAPTRALADVVASTVRGY